MIRGNRNSRWGGVIAELGGLTCGEVITYTVGDDVKTPRLQTPAFVNLKMSFWKSLNDGQMRVAVLISQKMSKRSCVELS